MLFKSKKFCRVAFRNKGSVLITVIIIMVIFAILAAAMYSLTTSSIFGHLHTLSATRATYIARSGYRYLASQYKHVTPATEVARNLALNDNLHGKTFQLRDNNGNFLLDVKPYYLMSLEAKTITNAATTLDVKFPGAMPNGYVFPASGTMAVRTTTGYLRFTYTGVTTPSPPNYHLTGVRRDGSNVTVAYGTSIMPVLSTPRTNPDQHLATNGSLTVTGASGIYPARFGFFEMPDINNTACAGYVYYYNQRTGDVFSGIRDAKTPDRIFDCTIVDSTAARRRVYVHTSAEINSTGIYNPGLGPAVSSTFSRMTILGFNPGDVSHVIEGVDGWVAIGTGVGVDTGNQQIQLGQGLADTAGVVWYAGNADAGNCNTGLCDFGLGIRAYFTFQDSYTGSHGDGFMFMLINGILNDTTKRGGTVSGSGMGELMGYAGPGNSSDGLGLQPPKISIEFDKYVNAGVSSPIAGCGNGRNDTANNHMALMLWGANTAGTCSGGINDGLLAVSFDDNIHNAGTAGSPTVPINSYSGTPSPDCATDPTQPVCGYYEPAIPPGSSTWLNTTATHTFRIEVIRAATPNGSNYDYDIKAWIDCIACNDLTVPFGGTAQINRRISLDPTPHANFHKVFFGFTQGTGSARQTILISNFAIYFPPY